MHRAGCLSCSRTASSCPCPAAQSGRLATPGKHRVQKRCGGAGDEGHPESGLGDVILGQNKTSKQGGPAGDGGRVGQSRGVDRVNQRPDTPSSPCRKPHQLPASPPHSSYMICLTHQHYPPIYLSPCEELPLARTKESVEFYPWSPNLATQFTSFPLIGSYREEMVSPLYR